jgi:octaprenyl-diphosphate synthase
VSLSNISRPIDKDLERFNSSFKTSMKSKVGIVDLIANYIIKQKGKKIRPLLVLLSAKACGEISDRTYRGATLVELLHTATLVHDDVVDNADKRRGLPSINAVWKNKIAVLMGDYLLSRGLMIAIAGKDFDFLENITKAVQRMAEGELLQIKKTRKLDIDEETYFKIISDKTASLLETCSVIGAMSVTDKPEYISAMNSYGISLGIAFQIKDDILDYEGTSKVFGKPIGGDIKEKKITLPLIYALKSVDKSKASYIRSLLKKIDSKNSVSEIIEFVRTQNGIKYAEEVMQKYANEAKTAIAGLHESAAKTSLLNLVDFVVSRTS